MKITNLSKKLGNFSIDIESLELEEGLIHGFIGFNGSGKTSLSKIIMGIIEIDKGEIDLSVDPKDITMTSQRPYFIHASVYDNICYPLKIRNSMTAINEKKIDWYLESFGLKDKKNQYALSLSSGERQKVSMIRALIFNPKWLIIDESFSNMDLDTAEKFKSILRQKHKKGLSVILISHNLPLIYDICQKIHFFDSGKIIASGDKDSILINPKNERIKSFVKSQLIEV